ncbi:MAG TPA: hypothetical protein PLX54_08120 [Candidatus Fermentibacter daniensis]|nr:hypothetical protein [Candidatus Fermentibacter daniensis]HOR07112.1 hypothetical protein [Candidatus Fermentibacter daniensis]HPK52320.1 hypothetical protein [Candidatus Fermentibacter daniensis]
MRLFIAALFLVSFTAFASDAVDDIWTPVPEYSGTMQGGSVWNGPLAVLFDNGPFVNSPGTGYGGADESKMDELESTYGFGCQYTVGNRLADQFEIPDGSNWNITSISFFGYQTGSGPVSPFTGVYMAVHDDFPATGAIVYGDPDTNFMTSTAFANCYRVLSTGSGNPDRPVMVLVCEFTDLTLSAGTYYLNWSLAGSGSSGPWAGPVTITGQYDTGDAFQYTSSGWSLLAMGGTGAPQGMPFIIEGDDIGALQSETWAGIKSLFN